MERCPQCRARLKGRNICSRCQTDLTISYTIESTADIFCRSAVKKLLTGELQTARNYASTALDLHTTPFHSALAGFLEQMDVETHSASPEGCNDEEAAFDAAPP